MGDRFYGVELLTSRPIGVLPPILGSIQAWKALDNGRRITFVRSRPDIIAYHLGGSTYFSNVPSFEADLEAIRDRATEPGELRLLELRYVENGRIPLGIFEPVTGWAIRDVVGFLRCEVPFGAAIALCIYRTYAGGPNIVTPEGALVREMLPHFNQVWRRETGSFIGTEPDISIEGRIAEARHLLAEVTGHSTSSDCDADTEESGAAFEAEMERLARGVELGAALAALLARYSYTDPW
jgi:hypothetical protein